MQEEIFRKKIGNTIITSSIGLFILLFILWILGGFESSEFNTLMKFYVPIKSVYISAIFKYYWGRRTSMPIPDSSKMINKDSSFVSKVLVYSYLFLVFALLLFKSLGFGGEFLSFDTLITLLSSIETMFGVIIGLIIADLYKSENITQ